MLQVAEYGQTKFSPASYRNSKFKVKTNSNTIPELKPKPHFLP